MSWVEDIVRDTGGTYLEAIRRRQLEAETGTQMPTTVQSNAAWGQAQSTALERAMERVYGRMGMNQNVTLSSRVADRFAVAREHQVAQIIANLIDDGSMQPGPYGSLMDQAAAIDPRAAMQLQDYRFGGQRPAVPSEVARRNTRDPIMALFGVKRTEALRIMRELPDDAFIALQVRFMQAGLYGSEKPTLGLRTTAESQALDRLMFEAVAAPDKSLKQVVDELTERYQRATAEELGLTSQLGTSLEDINVLTVKPVEYYEDLVDSISSNLIGMTLDQSSRRAMAEDLRRKEIGSQQQMSTISNALRRSESGTDTGELDAFMQAIGLKESGGNYSSRNSDSGASGKYQIMPSNWPSWSKLAGLPSNAAMTPENQERVAKTVMTMYYNQFGNWRDVAIAWYAGPGKVGAATDMLNRTQRSGKNEYPSINGYADDIMGRMQNILKQSAGSLQSMIDPATGNIIVDEFDPQSEADRAIRAARKNDVTTYGFASQAKEFFSLLGGVV
jgi:hypothetical protein